MVLKFLLFLEVFHVVNHLHFPPINIGIPGMAPANALMLLVLLAMRGKEEIVTARPFLTNAILYFFGALTFAFVWAELREPGNFLDDFTYIKNALFAPLFYFIFLKCKQDLKTTRLLMLWVLVIAAVAGLEGFVEGIDYGFGNFNPFRRASGPFGVDWHNANRAGVFYSMFMPMFVATALFLKRQKLVRLGAIWAIIVTAGGAISTYSRQSYFLILFSSALLLVRKNILVAVVIGIAAVSAVGYLPDSVTQRVEETKQHSKKGEEEVDVSTSSRWELWEGGMYMLMSNPIGVGLNRWKNQIGNYSSYKHIDAHNFYVLTLCECGPQGEFTLLFLFYTLFRLASWCRKNRPEDDPEALAWTLGFTVMTMCTAMGGIYGSPTLENSVMAPYWAFAGLLERYIHLKSMGVATNNEPIIAREATMEERFPLAQHAPGARR
jgi:hypothetical protein